MKWLVFGWGRDEPASGCVWKEERGKAWSTVARGSDWHWTQTWKGLERTEGACGYWAGQRDLILEVLRSKGLRQKKWAQLSITFQEFWVIVLFQVLWEILILFSPHDNPVRKSLVFFYIHRGLETYSNLQNHICQSSGVWIQVQAFWLQCLHP